jgi:hypothetical protein
LESSIVAYDFPGAFGGYTGGKRISVGILNVKDMLDEEVLGERRLC